MRPLTTAEKAMLHRVGEQLLSPEQQGSFFEQLAVLCVRDEDPGHLSFVTTASQRKDRPIFDVPRSVFDVQYDDDDGEPVSMILHFAHGELSWLERYRHDDEPIHIFEPSPDALRFAQIGAAPPHSPT